MSNTRTVKKTQERVNWNYSRGRENDSKSEGKLVVLDDMRRNENAMRILLVIQICSMVCMKCT